MTNPYLSHALAKPWAVTDTYLGREYVLWRYTWAWQAKFVCSSLGYGSLKLRNLEQWQP